MAAKVLLGVVALAAIVGSPIAYSHFKSPSGETQKEKEAPRSEEAAVTQPSAELQKPETQEDRQDTNEQSSLPEEKSPVAGEEVRERAEDVPKNQNSVQAGAPSGPKSDECQLEGTTGWGELPTLGEQMTCVRKQIKESRGSN